MADSIRFTIGGKLGASYRGALSEAEREAMASGARMRAAAEAELRGLPVGSAPWRNIQRQIMQEKVMMATQTASMIAAEERANGVRTGEEKIAANRRALDRVAQDEMEASRMSMSIQDAELAAIEAKKLSDAEAMAASIRDTSGALEWANIAEQQRTAALAKAALERSAIRNAEAVAAIEAANLAVAAGGGARANGPSMGHGGGGFTGIIRESVVIMRELAMGRGMGRVAGSVTLLAQYMGLLGKVVKSTAAEALLHASAESKLAQEMAATAAATRNQLGWSMRMGAARKQEAIAAKAATEAEIALQTAKVAINPLGWALIGGGVIVGVLVGIALHMQRVAERARNLADALDPLRKKFTEEDKAARDAAKGNEDYLETLKKINSEAETLPEKLDAIIKKIREQSQAEIELARARGASGIAIEKMEEAQLRAELEATTAAKNQAKLDEKEAADNFAAANKNLHGAFGIGVHSDAGGMAKAAERAASIVDALQERTDNARRNTPSTQTFYGPTGMPITMASKPVTDQQEFTVKDSEGKEVTTSLARAKAAFQNLSDKAATLAAAEEELKRTYSDANSTLEERKKATERLTKAELDYQNQIDIKEKFGPQIAALQSSHGGGHALSMTSWEKAGGGMGPQVHLDIARQQLRVQHQIARNTAHMSHSGGSSHRGADPFVMAGDAPMRTNIME